MPMDKIISELNIKELFNNIKRFILDVHKELDLDKAQRLKSHHQVKFRELRLRYIDLISHGRQFAEQSIPLLQYSIDKLNEIEKRTPPSKTASEADDNNYLDIEMLSKMLDKMDPSDLLKKCDSLERDVIAFNDEIKLDKDYKTSLWKKWGSIILGGVTVVASIALVAVMPWALPIELAIVAGAILCGAALVSAVKDIQNAFSANQLQSDIQELSARLKAAHAQIGSIKKQLSAMQVNQNHIKI
ncbi:unnamed protein product, partial [Rotaria sp. Silwood1]